MAKNPFKAATKNLKATAKAYRTDTRSDFKVTQQGLDAILGNMLTTQTGLGSAASRENLRTITQMGRFSDRQVGKLRAGPGRAQAAITSRFGAALGDVAGAATAEARVTAKAGAGATRAAARLGTDLGAAGSAAMDISKQFAKAAVGSGNYELGLALRDRTTIDNEAILEARTALQEQKLQWELDQQRMAQEAEYNERYLRLQTKLSGGGTEGAADESYTAASETLAQFLQSPTAGTGTADVPAVMPGAAAADARVAALVLQYGLDPSQELRLYQQADILTEREPRSALAAGVAPEVVATGVGVGKPVPPSARVPIPYGEDPDKPWEKALTDTEKDSVAPIMKQAYIKLAASHENKDPNTWNLDGDAALRVASEALGVYEAEGAYYIADPARDYRVPDKKISKEKYDGYLSYAVALLSIRTGIGGYQGTA